MKRSDLGRYALGSCAAIAMLAGCGGSQARIGAPMEQNALPSTSTLSPQAQQFSVGPQGSKAGISAGYKLLRGFKGSADGSYPVASLAEVNGTLYGTTAGGGSGCAGYGCGTIFRISPAGTGYRVLYRFKGGADGEYPKAGLIAVNGALYGTTYGYGTRLGTVFKLSLSGRERTLYRFRGVPDGAAPNSNLVEVNGELYGTTSGGGASAGTVFAISTSGVERVLYTFPHSGDDGADPEGVIFVNGALYGTTNDGGKRKGGLYGVGTIFKVSLAGDERVIYNFKGNRDGRYPNGGLTAVNGVLYGTTESTAFSVSTSGGELHVIHRFTGGRPGAGLTALNDALYGTTVTGGDLPECLGTYRVKIGCGVVFKLGRSGRFSILHTFKADQDGSQPQASLITLKGALYSTTASGGGSGCGGPGCGTVFRLLP